MSSDPQKPLYVTVHVDNIKICRPGAKAFKELIHQKFPAKPHGLKHYLGLDIKRDRAQHTIHLSQASYTALIIKEFSHLAIKSNVPLLSLIKDTTDAKPTPEEVQKYQQIVGKLMYLACKSRPDIHFTVIYTSRYITKPPPDAWRVIREILRYIDYILTYGIKIQGTDNEIQLY